jgi:fructose-bisphosphate aldolase class II
MLLPTGELVARAAAAGGAVPAFNVIGLEHAEAVVAGAEAAGAAVLLQISANAVAFREGRVAPLAGACAAIAAAGDAPVGLHLDHAEDLDLCREAVAAGCSSVMFDGDAEATARAATWARDAGVWIEGELDDIGGKPGATATGASDPARAAAYVARTGVDALAVAVGSRHKMTDRSARLDLDLLARLRAAVPVPLVLHGSSGVRDDDLRAAARHGIAKVNVGTRLNVAYTTAVRRALEAAPREVDPRGALRAARDAMAAQAAEVARLCRPPAAAPVEERR